MNCPSIHKGTTKEVGRGDKDNEMVTKIVPIFINLQRNIRVEVIFSRDLKRCLVLEVTT